MKVKIVRWGSSLAVRIPKSAAEKARLREGDFLEIEATEDEIAFMPT
jgi:antitoxin component of MazEF toxin-antitoxin module